MLNGILQKLNIIVYTDTRLVLREYPRMEWLAVLGLLIVAANTAIWGFWVTAAVALGIAVLLGTQAEVRTITFDVATDQMTIHLQAPLRNRLVNRIPLHHISRAYLSQAQTDHTQIVLVSVVGDEMGLSVYSRDVRPWKDDIVIAINAILHQAHKDAEEREALI